MRIVSIGMRIMFIMMFASRRAASFTKEGEVRCASHVRRRQECAAEANNHERVVTAIANVVDDFVL